MVLSPKRWKSRSSPGIAAGVREVRVLSEPIHNSSSRVELVSAGRHWLGAGWSSPVARQAHNLKVVGSNPTPATSAHSPPPPPPPPPPLVFVPINRPLSKRT